MGVRLEVHTTATRGGDEALVYEFDQARVTVGRAAASDIQLPDPTVSVSHASIRAHQTGYAVFDEGSTNGTLVNGTRIAAGRSKPLRTGDVVQIGTFTLKIDVAVAVPGGTSADQTAQMARRLARAIFEGRGDVLGQASLTVLNGPSEGERVELPQSPVELRIGRGETCAIALSDADLSREHALVRVGVDGVWIEDLGSKNGLKVNGRSMRRRRLRDRDEIEVGRTVLCFEDPESYALRSLEKEPDAELDHPPPAKETDPPLASSSATGEGDGEVDETRSGGAPVEAPAAEGRPSSLRPTRDGRFMDMLIYMLAGAVLALSTAGLYLLLRHGG